MVAWVTIRTTSMEEEMDRRRKKRTSKFESGSNKRQITLCLLCTFLLVYLWVRCPCSVFSSSQNSFIYQGWVSVDNDNNGPGGSDDDNNGCGGDDDNNGSGVGENNKKGSDRGGNGDGNNDEDKRGHDDDGGEKKRKNMDFMGEAMFGYRYGYHAGNENGYPVGQLKCPQEVQSSDTKCLFYHAIMVA